jgi:NitT/TauT family transport system ATP-binding protein
MRSDVIEFKDVSVVFGQETLYDRLNLNITDGEFVCILGPSGCGKSTSLRLMGDLLSVTSGSVKINGCPPSEAWKDLSYVFQSPRLVPWRSALGNVLLGTDLRFGRGAKKEREERGRDLLKLVGLERDMNKYPSALSGGERQRVAIARALSVDPKVVLMDEPFSALDVNTRTRLRSELISIWNATGKTIVFVTHDIEEALVLADRIIVFSKKPTRVLETLQIDEPRPRVIEHSSELKMQRRRLHELFGGQAESSAQNLS